MGLFTDGEISTVKDLAARDSQLLAVVSVEGIDVTQKLLLAQEEIELELKTMLGSLNYAGPLFWVPPVPDVGSVVVTPALKQWHTLRSLELVYRDAYNSQLNDRYGGKRDQFREMAKWAYEKLIDTGLGIATCPLAKAGTPSAATVDGAALPDGTYYVTAAWTNERGEEGVCADPTTVTTSACTFAVQPAAAAPNATGWNVYAGDGPENLTLQNEAPIAVGAAWLQPGALTAAGRTPGSGQIPNYWKPVPRMIQRG